MSLSQQKIRVAVIGVGYLGRLHAQKYKASATADLIGVVDSKAITAQAVADEFTTTAYQDYRPLLDKIDAVSIVVPAQHHYAIARDFLDHGVHVLVEKPMTTLAADAHALVAAAAQKSLVLQVGLLERFNPAVLALEGVLKNPMFIESHRVAPFNIRGIDVSVVLDLMIHDIDLILNVVDAPVTRIDANGAAVLTSTIDIANARLQFANGCVANVTASRAGFKSERRMRVFQQDAYISMDLANRKLTVRRKAEGTPESGIPEIISDEQTFAEHDALATEIAAFLDCVAHGKRPLVSGEVGVRALEVASEITRLLLQEPSLDSSG